MRYDEWLAALYETGGTLTNLNLEPDDPSDPADDPPFSIISKIELK